MAMISDAELVRVIDAATERYRGDTRKLETAIGALAVGRLFGWKPLLIIHSHPIIKSYEKILDVKFRDVLPAEGRRADKSLAWRVVQAGKHFWDVLSARVPGRSPLVD